METPAPAAAPSPSGRLGSSRTAADRRLIADPGRRLARSGIVLAHLLAVGPRPERWSQPGFAREVERIRWHLEPIRSRALLARSFARESFHLRAAPDAGATLAATPAAVAYAIRWLELAEGRSARPTPAPGRAGAG